MLLLYYPTILYRKQIVEGFRCSLRDLACNPCEASLRTVLDLAHLARDVVNALSAVGGRALAQPLHRARAVAGGAADDRGGPRQRCQLPDFPRDPRRRAAAAHPAARAAAVDRLTENTLLNRSWEKTIVFICYNSCSLMQVAGASVVAKACPKVQNLVYVRR